VLLTYFLVRELFPSQPLGGGHSPTIRGVTYSYQLSVISSLLLAISPWHIMLSRAAFEANVATFFLVAGVTFFLAGIRRGKMPARQLAGWLVASAASFALSLQTFNTARIAAPLLVLILVMAFRKTLWQQKKISLVAIATGLLIILPAVSFLLSPQAKLRFKEVNIFSDQSIVMMANQEIVNDQGATWSKLIHNRRWAYVRAYLRHYFDHFNPAFLFFKGDGNPKFSIQDVGQLYLWELPFLIWGALVLVKKKPGFWWLIPCWLLVGILPAATARETPHALRIETTLPTWQIFTAFGVVSAWQWLPKKKPKLRKLSLIAYCLILIASFVYFQHGYWRHYPIKFSGEWQYGYQPALEFIKQAEGNYDQIWLTEELGRPYIYCLFYLQKEPREFWQEAVVERDTFGFVKVKSFAKYHFFREQPVVAPTGKTLVIEAAKQFSGQGQLVKTFWLLDGSEVFKAYEVGHD